MINEIAPYLWRINTILRLGRIFDISLNFYPALEKSDFEELEIGDPDESYITSDATLSDEMQEIENSDFYCEICKKGFTKRSILNLHKIHTHGEGDISVPTVECTICTGRFVSSKSLKIHQNQIHETNMPECHFCKYKFPSIKNLRKHMKNRKWFYFSDNLLSRIFFPIFTLAKYYKIYILKYMYLIFVWVFIFCVF